jgi:hypothetical protein
MLSTRTGGLVGAILGLALVVPSAAFAGSPVKVDTQDPDPCVANHSLGLCDRPGGFAAKGQKALLLTFDGGDVVHHVSSDAGATWTGAMKVGGNAVSPQVLGQDGDSVAYAYLGAGGTEVATGLGFSIGELGDPVATFQGPRQVTTQLAADVENGVFAWAAAGYDEIPQGRKGSAIRIRRDSDGIGDTPILKTVAWNGVGCGVRGTDPSLAVTGSGDVVLAYWQTCDKLVVRRIDFLSDAVSKPLTLSTRHHGRGMSMDAEGNTVVIAYTADGTTWTRRSTDGGRTWGAPRLAGTGASSLRVANLDGGWHLLSAGATSVRYRSSANGTSWSAGKTIDSQSGARTFALGLAFGGGKVLAAYAIRESKTAYGLYVAAR